MFLLRRTLILLAAVSLCHTARTADRDWEGAIDTNWGTAGNWRGGRPGNGDNAVFNTSFTNQPTLNANAQVDGLWMTNGVGQNVTLNGSGTLSLSGGTINGVAGLGILVDNTTAYSLTINAPLAATANQTWRNNSLNVLSIGAVNLFSSTLTLDGSGTTAISGVISGAGSMIKNGTGTLVLSGANTFGGSLTIAGGAVKISHAGALGSLSTGTSVLNGAALQLEGGVVFNAEAVALLGSGIGGTGALRNLSGNNTYTGLISLGVSTTIGSSADLLTLSGSVATNGYLATFNGAGSTQVSGVVSGTGGIIKNGEGTLILSGANTYSGGTNLHNGVLNVRHSSGLGTTAGGTIVSNGAELQVQGGIAIGAESLTLNGSGESGDGALRNMSGNNLWAGNITLASSSRIASDAGQLILSGTIGNGGNGADLTVGGAGNTLVSGVITGNGDVVKDGSGTLTLQGANTYTGATIANGGTMHVTGSLNGNTGTALTFGGDATVNFNEAANRAQGMGVLTFAGGDGTVESTYAGSGSNSVTFSGLGTRGVGATGNFVVSGGTNGVTNKIVLTGQPSGFIDQSTYFNGNDYAYVDPTGYVRAINYGVDPGTAVSNGGISLTGDHVKANGKIDSQGTQRFETLHIASNIEYVLGSNQKVTVNGILKTGNVPGGAIIYGGDYLRADLNTEMSIRAAEQNDFLTIETPIIANGTNAVTKSGAGTILLTGDNSYTGGTYVTQGTLQIGASERLLNSGSLTVTGGTFDVQNFTETVVTVVLASGAINGNGAGTVIGTSYNVQSGSASAILAGTAALTKNTAGTVTLSGANTYTGATTVNDGTLVAAAAAGGALANTVSVTVNADGNLALGASNQINNAAPVTLAGGTLSKGDFSEGTSTAVGAGTLSLTADGATIDFGTGTAGTLAFAIFDAGSYSLTIDNWTGTAGAVGNDSTDRLIFASDPSASLANFLFSGYAPGAVALLLDGGFYEVTPASLTPVPEMNPAMVASLLCAGVGVLFHRRKVRAKKRAE